MKKAQSLFHIAFVAAAMTPSEIAAVRCVVESCASDLDDAWAEV